MSRRFWALALTASGFALLHCGGTVENTTAAGSGGAAGHGAQGSHAGDSASAGRGSGGSGALPLDAGLDEYVDPGCPDAGPPLRVDECDAFAARSNCPAGQGCYPYVKHPLGDGCGKETFGTQCATAGTGYQGDLCGDGTGQCSSGFVCVVGAQPGMHCVKLCMMGDPASCPRGMICGELDVEGFGVCS